MKKIKHYLNFINDGFGRLEIEEPIGYDATTFVLSRENWLAVDTSYSKGEVDFEFTKMYHEEVFTKLVEYFEVYDTEAKVMYENEYENNIVVIGDLDFQMAAYNGYDVFKCKIIQDSKEALLKKRSEISVDLYSDKDLDDNTIEPCQSENILLLAKPVQQFSEWDSGLSVQAKETEKTAVTDYFFVAPYFNNPVNGISTTYGGSITGVSKIENDRSIYENFKIIQAKDNITDLVLEFDFNYTVKAFVQNGGEGYIRTSLIVYEITPAFNIITGKSLGTRSKILYVSTGNEQQSYNSKLKYKNPLVSRGNMIVAFIYTEVKESTVGLDVTDKLGAQIFFNSCKIKGSCTSQSYNTVIKGVRLYDAVKYNVQSTCGLNTVYPLAQSGGYFENVFLTNGAGLRRIEKPFYVNIDDLRKFFLMHAGDLEITDSEKVFIGEYKDFYRNEEIFVVEDAQFDDFEKTINQQYAINAFNFQFNKNQSQNENTEKNTLDVIHGIANWSLLNKGCENKKEIDIPIVFDAFAIEKEKINQLAIDDTTASKEDDTIFGIDCILKDTTKSFTENIYGLFSGNGNIVTITNDGSFSFNALGLKAGDVVILEGYDIYTVYETPDFRTLKLYNAYVGGIWSGVGYNKITYIPTNYTYVSRGIEGIDTVSNIFAPDIFTNLRFSCKRMIEKFWNSYLATANLQYKDKNIKSSYYSRNRECTIAFDGLTTVEGADFTPKNPILSKFSYSCTVILNYTQWIELITNIKTKHGYIRMFTPDGFPFKIYPHELEFSLNNKDLRECKLRITGEEKLDLEDINIVTENGQIHINNEYIVSKLKSKEKRNKIYIFDNSNKLLYKPAYWQKVLINGQKANNLNELKQWLNNLS